MSRARLTVPSPVGPLTLCQMDGAITALAWGGEAHDQTPLLDAARDQLAQYFAGRRRDFDLPLAPAGTAFQRRVWQAMAAIPFGATRSYGALARELASGARAVGMACGANPLPILIPCHRVVATAGLGGYSGAGGLDTKRALLTLEGGRLRH